MAAIGDEYGAGDVGSGIGDKKQQGAVEVFGTPQPALRDAPDQRLPGFGGKELAVDIGLDIAGTERVDADIVARKLQSQRLR